MLSKDEFLNKVTEGSQVHLTEQEVMDRLTDARENNKAEVFFDKRVLTEDMVNSIKKAGFSIEDYEDEHTSESIQIWKVGW